jgi:outer membrane protein assembly factor BamB
MTSDWAEGQRANLLFVGPGDVDAAMAAGKLRGIRAYVVSDTKTLYEKRLRVDKEGLYGRSVVVREGALEDTTFPDYFFHRVVILGSNTEVVKNGKELWRITRPGGKVLLGKDAQTLRLDETEKHRVLNVDDSKWTEVTRPVVGAEWCTEGGSLHPGTIWPAHYSPDTLIKPPLKHLWVTMTTSAAETNYIFDGKIYGNRQVLDAYTGDILDEKAPQGLIGAAEKLMFVRGNNLITALDRLTGEKRWAQQLEFTPKHVAIVDGKVVCADSQGRTAYLNPENGSPTSGSLHEKGPIRWERWELTKNPSQARSNPGFWQVIVPDGTVWEQSGQGEFLVQRPDSKKPTVFLEIKPTWNCSTPVAANSYLWVLLGGRFAALDMRLPSEQMLQTAWYHRWGNQSCRGPIVAYGNLYLRTQPWHRQARFMLCFASGEPYPEQNDRTRQLSVECRRQAVDGPTLDDPQDWPMFHRDFRRTGNSPDKEIKPPLTVLWKTPTGGPVRCSPAVVGDRVYVGSSDHKFYAINAQTGKVVWSFIAGDEVFSSPCVWSGMVYFGSDDGVFYCLDASTGELIWRMQVDPRDADELAPLRDCGPAHQSFSRVVVDGIPKRGPQVVRSAPLVVDGRVYFGTGLGRSSWGFLYCADARTGKLIWKRKAAKDFLRARMSESIDYGPAYANGKIYVHGCQLEALDAKTGKEVDFSDPSVYNRTYYTSYSQITLAGDRAFINGGMNPDAEFERVRLLCVSLETGSVIGHSEQMQPYKGNLPCAVVVDDIAYCAGGGRGPEFGTTANSIVAYSTTAKELTRARRKDFRVSRTLTGSPAYANGFLFCPGGSWLVIIDVKTGENTELEFDEELRCSPAIARGRLWVGSDDGYVYCLGNK